MKLSIMQITSQLCIVVGVLVSAGLVAGEIYQIPALSLTTPKDSVCPSDDELEAARANISRNISDILVELTTTIYTIPECGGSGWRQIAFLNMTAPNQTCPESWTLFSLDSVTACGRQESDNTGRCDSVQFSPDGYEYTQVCGRIIAYLHGNPDGAEYFFSTPTPGNEINEPYLDGVSITYGTPRQHIWSLYAGRGELCCGFSHLNHIQSFVEDNFFCDTSAPLWDGITECPSDDTCCAPYTGPWFNTTLAVPTTEYIEVRICGDECSDNEDTPVELIEIYVK
jgi:hypothetical protein